MNNMRYVTNRYFLRFLIAVATVFTLFILISIYIYSQREDLLKGRDFYALAKPTLLFLLICGLSVPVVLASMFNYDDNNWEDRRIHLAHLKKKLSIRESDLNLAQCQMLTANQASPQTADAPYKAFKKSILGPSNWGLFLHWDTFNAWMARQLEMVKDGCHPNEADAPEKLQKTRQEIAHMTALNDRWFFWTSRFLVFWAIVCGIALCLSFYWLVETFLTKFPLWFDVPSDVKSAGYIKPDEIPKFAQTFVVNETIRSILFDVFDVYNQVKVYGEVKYAASTSNFLNFFVLLFRFFIFFSLFPLFIGIKRLVRYRRLTKELDKSLGL